jgi:hypothetical protein
VERAIDRLENYRRLCIRWEKPLWLSKGVFIWPARFSSLGGFWDSFQCCFVGLTIRNATLSMVPH